MARTKKARKPPVTLAGNESASNHFGSSNVAPRQTNQPFSRKSKMKLTDKQQRFVTEYLRSAPDTQNLAPGPREPTELWHSNNSASVQCTLRFCRPRPATIECLSRRHHRPRRVERAPRHPEVVLAPVEVVGRELLSLFRECTRRYQMQANLLAQAGPQARRPFEDCPRRLLGRHLSSVGSELRGSKIQVSLPLRN